MENLETYWLKIVLLTAVIAIAGCGGGDGSGGIDDTTPPETTITSGPENPTNSTNAIFTFTSSESGSTFSCSLDDAAYENCIGPKEYSAITEGDHIFKVRATDDAGNADPTPAIYTWEVDTTPPDTTIISGPESLTSSSSAIFEFASTETISTYQCSIDGGAYEACDTPKEYSNLSEGSHTFSVLAIDTAGNPDPSPAGRYSWTIDITPPDATITTTPDVVTNLNIASFSFISTETGSSFQCSLDGADYTDCTSPMTYSGLTDGSHTFNVYAIDEAGNADPIPAEYSWDVILLDVSVVPLWDGEVVDPQDLRMNRFGGNPVEGLPVTVTYVTDTVNSGTGAYRIDTNGTIDVNGFGFFATSLTGFASVLCDTSSAEINYIDTRDITGFDEVRFQLKNEIGSAFSLVLEIKDYRDSNDHRARKRFNINDLSEWQSFSTSLDLLDSTAGWVVIGNPDLTRTKLFAFVIEADQGDPVAGSIYLDDMTLIESGGFLDVVSAPIENVIDRIALRQFRGVWGSRDRDTGLVPTISSFANVSALNTTGALISLLPAAIDQGWINRTDADEYVNKVITSLNAGMDNVVAMGNGGFVPPRYIDRVCLVPNFVLEESSVDAAFIFLALYAYKSLVDINPTLRGQIESLLARFNFKAFADPAGWKLAYLYDTQAFTAGTYDGYSGEIWLISLAAHLQTDVNHHVDIEELYHSGVKRTEAYLIDQTHSHVVHEYPEFRAPFLQWLFHLFVDVSDRGVDTYPIAELATNPYDNALEYQWECQGYLTSLGRELFQQPDAGDDGTGSTYEQFSCYEDLGQLALFMPWSVAFSLLADPDLAGPALRHHIQKGLHGPLGLSDSAVWETGASAPSRVPARHDFWNLSLSTMALMQYSFGINRPLTDLPEVREALDRVFLSSTFITRPHVYMHFSLAKD